MLNKIIKSSLLTYTLILAINSTVFCSTSYAEQSIDNIRDPYYVGLGLGVSFLQPEKNSIALTLSQDSDLAYKVLGGYQFDDHWAAEFFWTDMGLAEITSLSTGNIAASVKYQAFGVGGLYQYPVTKSLDVFATAGIGRLRNSFRIVGGKRVEDSFIYLGTGALWNLAPTWDLRAEYDYYDTDAQVLMLNIVKRFGSASTKRIARLEQKVQQQEKALSVVPKKLERSSVAAFNTKDSCDDYSIELKDVVFAAGSIVLTSNSNKILDDLAKQLIKLPKDITFEIRAHTDNVGTELYNYSLSLARARMVRDYLSMNGVALGRIDAQGYGEWRPKQDNSTESGQASNRRAELVLIGVEKYVENTEACPTSVVKTTSQKFR